MKCRYNCKKQSYCTMHGNVLVHWVLYIFRKFEQRWFVGNCQLTVVEPCFTMKRSLSLLVLRKVWKWRNYRSTKNFQNALMCLGLFRTLHKLLETCGIWASHAEVSNWLEDASQREAAFGNIRQLRLFQVLSLLCVSGAMWKVCSSKGSCAET